MVSISILNSGRKFPRKLSQSKMMAKDQVNFSKFSMLNHLSDHPVLCSKNNDKRLKFFDSLYKNITSCCKVLQVQETLMFSDIWWATSFSLNYHKCTQQLQYSCSLVISLLLFLHKFAKATRSAIRSITAHGARCAMSAMTCRICNWGKKGDPNWNLFYRPISGPML